MSLQGLFDTASTVTARTAPGKACLRPFVVLDWGGASPRAGALQAAFALTPRVMEWGEGLWLLDLSVCLTYWSAQAAFRGADPLQLIGAQLEAVAAEHGIKAWSGVMAAHPWQGLLLARHMRERDVRGFLSVDGPFGQTLFREVGWDTWRSSIESLAAHRWALGIKPSEPATIRKQLTQMERAVKRLGLRTPWSLREIPGDQLRRRFGALVRDARDWAYGEDEASDLFATGFPWQGVVIDDKPRVVTHLEHPLCEWEHIEPLLREDFDRLCALATWQAGERVVSLEWRLVFRDLSNLAVFIRFRHPHPLHLEKGAHATALLQAFYSFQSSVPRQSIEGAAGQVLEAEAFAVPIVSWSLVVDERLSLPPRALTLFDDGVGSDALALLHMENRLKIPLEAYELRSDWLPEDSYCRAGLATADGSSAEALPSLRELARTRPLFLYESPQRFDNVGTSAAWEFRERTAVKWWESAAGSSSVGRGPMAQRDYYRLTDREQRSYWVYRDTQSQCFVHGVYA